MNYSTYLPQLKQEGCGKNTHTNTRTRKPLDRYLAPSACRITSVWWCACEESPSISSLGRCKGCVWGGVGVGDEGDRREGGKDLGGAHTSSSGAAVEPLLLLSGLLSPAHTPSLQLH